MPAKSQSEKPASIVPMEIGDFITVVILGGLVGLVVWGLGILMNTYIFEGYFCAEEAGRQCESAENYAAVAAGIIASLVALAGLIRLRVYRPLLVLLASMISAWGIVQMSWNLTWFTGLLVAIVLYALAFGVFSWLARVREFWIAVAAIFVLVLAVRFVITG